MGIHTDTLPRFIADLSVAPNQFALACGMLANFIAPPARVTPIETDFRHFLKLDGALHATLNGPLKNHSAQAQKLSL
jgi:hypothetical protein